MSANPGPLQELKRRRVPRVALVYVASAFAILQGVELAAPRLGVADSMITLLLTIAIAGFPVALMLSWFYELTPDGIRSHATSAPGVHARGWLSARAVAVATVALVLGSGAWIAVQRVATDEPRSIAVLPFDDLSPAGDQAYFADGIAEEISAALSRIDGLQVAGRRSSSAYRRTERDLKEIGRALGVKLVLEGSVKKDNEALRITVSLVDAQTGFSRWTETYDRELSSVFDIQEEIALSVASALRISLADGDRRGIVLSRTADQKTFDLYLRGQSLLKRRGIWIDSAVVQFNRAIERDSTYAPAWAGLAEAHGLLPYYRLPPSGSPEAGLDFSAAGDFYTRVFGEELEKAEHAARMALRIEPDMASAHLALGSILRDRRQWAAAEREYRAAIALDKDYAEAHAQYADLLASTGRYEDALDAARTAVRLDPLVQIYNNYLGFILSWAGHLDEGIAVLERAYAMDSTLQSIVGGNLETAYINAGRIDDLLAFKKREWAQQGSSLEGELASAPLTADEIGVLLRGLTDPALRDSARALVRNAPREFIETIVPAHGLMVLGDTARALDLLEAYTLAVPYGTNVILWSVEWSPVFDHPRHRALAQRLGINEVPAQARAAAERYRSGIR